MASNGWHSPAARPYGPLSTPQISGEVVTRYRQALRARDYDVLAAVNDREQLEALAEVLQKHALDVALASYAGRSRFGPAMASPNAAAWLRYARQMGKNRLLASHPLNPRLFAGEMIAGMPKA